MIKNYEYYTVFTWPYNPFTLTISPQLMVGYSSQTNKLLSHIFNSHKFALVIGHTGSGKTTLLTWLTNFINDSKKNFKAHYIPKPPKTREELITLFRSRFGYNILDIFRFKGLNTQLLPRFLTKKTRYKKTVLLVDEAHEASVEVLEWLRTLNDMVPNLLIVFAGLPSFEKKIETELTTLAMRVTTKTYLSSLNFIETESLIRKRIEDADGEGLKPFTSNAVKRIFEITGGFPREIIKICDKLVKEAAEKNIFTINETFVNNLSTSAHKRSETLSVKEIKVSIPDKQRKILDILNKKPKLSPTQIVENMDKESYKNKNNAIRSVNNILKRMMRDELIERAKMGNSYVYHPSGKAKSILAEA
ncbi:MAG: AAA family ATPase [Candidatus Aenigmarchaeota archaeon]|nr:AAA family ATPase [Candidatus Aenigmarchaeota archaeon]